MHIMQLKHLMRHGLLLMLGLLIARLDRQQSIPVPREKVVGKPLAREGSARKSNRLRATSTNRAYDSLSFVEKVSSNHGVVDVIIDCIKLSQYC